MMGVNQLSYYPVIVEHVDQNVGSGSKHDEGIHHVSSSLTEDSISTKLLTGGL